MLHGPIRAQRLSIAPPDDSDGNLTAHQIQTLPSVPISIPVSRDNSQQVPAASNDPNAPKVRKQREQSLHEVMM